MALGVEPVAAAFDLGQFVSQADNPLADREVLDVSADSLDDARPLSSGNSRQLRQYGIFASSNQCI